MLCNAELTTDEQFEIDGEEDNLLGKIAEGCSAHEVARLQLIWFYRELYS